MKWILCILAILLCGCLENEAHFDALNLGTINANYNNQTLTLSQDSSENSDFILFFFTSTCGVCKEQIPILEDLHKQNIRIYGILGDKSQAIKAREFIDSSNITMPIFYESNARRFFTNAIGGVKGVPVIAIFKNGKVQQKFIGLTPKSVLLNARL